MDDTWLRLGAPGFLVLEKHIKVPILDVVTCVLLLADFLLDIDVVLTKIEEIPNTYIGPLQDQALLPISGRWTTKENTFTLIWFPFVCVYVHIYIYIFACLVL